ncbi:hypothetical protein C8R41DRAFT_447504 [Lentinula lateritia]|uniref:Uncharacterized protein n=1 Tax=Lentinula lateritia TaxID=40482 RepID=A0ABQ8VCL0_9AGAR|nr:hypothetical protein C8R41DRAFT_447504 [Lentinula lateritia]
MTQLVSAHAITKLYSFLFVVLQLFLAKTVRTIPIGSETVHGGSSSDLTLDNHNFVTLDVSNTAGLSSSNRARAEGPTIIQAHIVVNTSLETPDDVLLSIHDATVSFQSVAYEEPRTTSKLRELAERWVKKWVGPARNPGGPPITNQS